MPSRYLRETGCEDVIDKGLDMFKLHDFGFRGVSSVESAAVGGDRCTLSLVVLPAAKSRMWRRSLRHGPIYHTSDSHRMLVRRSRR